MLEVCTSNPADIVLRLLPGSSIKPESLVNIPSACTYGQTRQWMHRSADVLKQCKTKIKHSREKSSLGAPDAHERPDGFSPIDTGGGEHRKKNEQEDLSSAQFFLQIR
jgi:hypothetical protein